MAQWLSFSFSFWCGKQKLDYLKNKIFESWLWVKKNDSYPSGVQTVFLQTGSGSNCDNKTWLALNRAGLETGFKVVLFKHIGTDSFRVETGLAIYLFFFNFKQLLNKIFHYLEK
ncbi:hypothetical protein R6Q59_011536 [Mikania micrantha]